MSEVTQILKAAEQGDAKAAGQLLPLVYGELRRLAAHRMAQEAPGHTLQPTALVHEAWLRLVGDEAPMFENRAHFFGAAAEAMRRILVESARRKKRMKHGGELERVDVDEVEVPLPIPDDELLALDEALDRLTEVDARAATARPRVWPRRHRGGNRRGTPAPGGEGRSGAENGPASDLARRAGWRQ